MMAGGKDLKDPKDLKDEKTMVSVFFCL